MNTIEDFLENLPIAQEARWNNMIPKVIENIIGDYMESIDTNEYFYKPDGGFTKSYMVINKIFYKNGKVKNLILDRFYSAEKELFNQPITCVFSRKFNRWKERGQRRYADYFISGYKTPTRSKFRSEF